MKRMWNKGLSLLLLLAFCLTLIPAPALANRLEQTPLEKIAVAEQLVYGNEQEGSLIDRTNRLEKELFGLPGRDALMAKVDKIYGYVRESSANSPSLAYKMNALE